jgi:hypothetical protein
MAYFAPPLDLPLVRPTVGSPDSPVHTGQSDEF